MFERLTDRARAALVAANAAAHQRGHHHIDTGEILLGIVRTDCIAAKGLLTLGVDAAKVTTWLDRLVANGHGSPLGRRLPLTPRAVRAIEAAKAEAESDPPSWYVGTEYVLSGLFAGLRRR